VEEPAGRPRAVSTARGKSGLRRAGCWREPGGGNLADRATESRPPGASSPQVRVKRCGKSAPARRATVAAGNPHPEQGRAGSDRGRPVRAAGWAASGRRTVRRRHSCRRERWSPAGRAPRTGSGLQVGSSTLVCEAVRRCRIALRRSRSPLRWERRFPMCWLLVWTCSSAASTPARIPARSATTSRGRAIDSGRRCIVGDSPIACSTPPTTPSWCGTDAG